MIRLVFSGSAPIIPAYAGMKTELLDMLITKARRPHHQLWRNVKRNCGNINSDGRSTPIARFSCFNGIAISVYAYEGGGVKLHQAGIMLSKSSRTDTASGLLIANVT